MDYESSWRVRRSTRKSGFFFGFWQRTNVRVDAAGLIIEYYSADLKGVPRAQKDRHWCHYEANKHWIEWVDDGLSERADVGPAKKRKLLPPSLR